MKEPYVFYYGSALLHPDHYAGDFKKIIDEVLSHLSNAAGVNLKVRVEIEAEAPEGFSDFHVRTVSENSSALKFEQARFNK